MSGPTPCIGFTICPAFIRGPAGRCLYINGANCLDFERVSQLINKPVSIAQKEVEHRVPGAASNNA